METTALIDGDIMAYQASASCQTDIDFGDGVVGTEIDEGKLVPKLEEHIYDVLQAFSPDNIVVCLSCPSEENFRLEVLPSYKENRKGKPKPVLYKDAIDYINRKWKVYQRPTLEADDVMGILSTSKTAIKGRKVIVSIDKDMQTIPGWLWNPSILDSKPRKISLHEANKWHMYQTLVGDTTDNYKGCPSIGDKRATKLLNDVLDSGTPWANQAELLAMYWESIIEQFEKKGLTEEDALVQARVARICRNTEYDFAKKEVILWTP